MNFLKNLLSRATVKLVNAKTKLQTLQLGLLFGELKGDVEHFEPYGFTAHPNPGAEALAAFFGGDRSHGIVVTVADRRFRLKELKQGEVALYDDLGQKIVLTRDGIALTTPLNLTASVQGTMTATVSGATKLKCPSLVVDCPQSTFTGALTVNKLITGQGGLSISGGSGASVDGSLTTTQDVVAGGISLQSHTHPGDSGGTTGVPQ